ncbi:protein TAPT1 homolog isoform X1 [Drosophila guanche]|uniref:Blast:Protein TAPT1 homolog n=1 Tax=Drosophila guanche TaxID=7266 RepID=A0A3B0KEG8_DROGU|nr:protein TAPT1 homolog isoform X1 [Drosophila guanche]SPP83441.1 blast:Protein TAPT1 homolog [Drosophila guanche]
MQNSINSGGNKRQLRFRGDVSGASSRVEELHHHQEENRQLKPKQQPLSQDDVAAATAATPAAQQRLQSGPTETGANTFLDFFKVEMTRGYMLEHDEERYSARRQKIYSFMRIPRDLERFMIYGIMQCADSFFYIHTFLPVRFLLAVWALVTRTVARICRLRSSGQRLLSPAEICDLLKGAIWITVTLLMLLVDTNRVYHIIKSQSIIKLYIFYNMLEVGDRLLSAFGQDTIDALFWTATEPKNSKREHFGAFTHVILTLTYVFLHSGLIMFQATCLNVALNSNNKGLLTIMISNNFVELKGSVFKKFDKNNLFQLTCSDVRERFHLSILLFIVIIQTMKEFDWSFTQFYVMVPDCIAVLFTEILIDWVKHAFITRFNELPEGIYREYTTSLAYDMTQTRQKHAFSDHSDLVARRMGFIPFPLSVVLIKAIYTAVSFHNLAAWLLFLLAYLFALGLRICLTICALGKACKLMKEHQTERNSSTPSSMTNMPFVGGTASSTAQPLHQPPNNYNNNNNNSIASKPTAAASTTANVIMLTPPCADMSHNFSRSSLQSTSTPKKAVSEQELDVTNSLELGATALFSNSDVDLDDVCLNEQVTNTNTSSAIQEVYQEQDLARSQPDLLQLNNSGSSGDANGSSSSSSSALTAKQAAKRPPKRTHKRSESEPLIQSLAEKAGGTSGGMSGSNQTTQL